MTQIALSEITIPENRQRREFRPGKIQELAESMASKGLLHPIVLRETCAEDGECVHVLVAGERRLRAALSLGWETIPYTLIQDLDELSIREAELEENVCRVDLTWQEKADALAALHALRLEQNPQQTAMDTAREVLGDDSLSKTEVKGLNQDIAKAAFVQQFKDDPEIQKARNLNEAHRLALRKARGEFVQLLNETASADAGATQHTLIHGDCVAEMERLEGDKLFSCIIADPPYGRGADQFGNAARGSHMYKDDPETARDIMMAIFDQGYAITTSDAHLYMFFDIDQWEWLLVQAATCGWKPFPSPLVWYKGSQGHVPWGPDFWRREYELIFFAMKGKRSLTKTHGDVIQGLSAERDREYAAAKPPALYQRLLELSCEPGDRVLDPCCGSGPIFTAAQATHTIATGIELDKDAHALALERLNSTRI